ncbi:hypothetical protein BKA65DRAFT_479006 [Rhexocercosporidium sp. MPI-PUGE-AT-0058]|nr:hypothetical protein BKA65DRAFT_479006 [Rhexocercosporidium sp. MPI-PUGE-AT-0058]
MYPTLILHTPPPLVLAWLAHEKIATLLALAPVLTSSSERQQVYTSSCRKLNADMLSALSLSRHRHFSSQNQTQPDTTSLSIKSSTMPSPSASPSPSPPPLFVNRKRSSTKKLLGPAWQQAVTEVIDAPQPEPNSKDYTIDRLRLGLQYADSHLRNPNRTLSPLGVIALTTYKNAIARVIDLENDDTLDDDEGVKAAKAAWLVTIREHEGYAQHAACVKLLPINTSKIQDEIIKLQRTVFYARYGDIFADICKQIKSQAEVKKVLGWQSLARQYWTQIDVKLQVEKPYWELVLKGQPNHTACPTHMAINSVCLSTDFEMNEVLVIIHHYAIRNELVHSNLELLIKEGNFVDLRTRLYNDWCDVPKVIAASDGLQASLMQRVIQAMIDKWFDIGKVMPENPQTWKASEELEKYCATLQGQCIEADAIKEMKGMITRQVARTLRDEQQEQKLLDDIEKNFSISTTPTKKQKRVASSKLEGEIKKAKMIHSEYNKLKAMASGIRKKSETYIPKVWCIRTTAGNYTGSSPERR